MVKSPTPSALLWFLFSLATGTFRVSDLVEFAEDPSVLAGVRSFRHTESLGLPDGGAVSVSWKVDADPDEIVSLDLARRKGLRLLACRDDSVTLQVPSALARASRSWRFLVASGGTHGCGTGHLYRRLAVSRPLEGVASAAGGVVRIPTEDLSSPARILPRAEFSLRYAPPAVLPGSRRTDAVDMVGDLGDLISDLSRPPGRFNWSWDFDLSGTHQSEFGGELDDQQGFIRLRDADIHLHAGLAINFTSCLFDANMEPHVQMGVVLEGDAFFSGDLSMLMKLKCNSSSPGGCIDGPSIRYAFDFLDEHQAVQYGSPLKFYLGSIPVTIQPGLRVGVSAHHMGRFEGSMRFGVKVNAKVKVGLEFDSLTGVNASFSTDLTDLKIWPPTWQIYTRRFELGAAVEPEVWLTGTFGDVRDMRLGMGLKPYVNVSIWEEDADSEAVAAGSNGTQVQPTKRLAVYPFLITGLPDGEAFAVKIGVHGRDELTTTQLSIAGVVEIADPVELFDFGAFTSGQLQELSLEVSLLRAGAEPPVALTSAFCTELERGACAPVPLVLNFTVDGRDVALYLAVELHDDDGSPPFGSRVRSLAVSMPQLSVTPGVVAQLGSSQTSSLIRLPLPGVQLRFRHAGTVFGVALRSPAPEVSRSSNFTFASGEVLELGVRLLDAWHASVAVELAPRVELVRDDEVLGFAVVPRSWLSLLGGQSQDAHNSSVALGTSSQSLVLHDAEGADVGTVQLSIQVQPRHNASFWVFPNQVTTFRSGESFMLYWTAATDPGEVDFSLEVFRMLDDGTLQGQTPPQILRRACTIETNELHGYHNYANLCTFSAPLLLSGADGVVGHRLVLSLAWTFNLLEHRILSAPVLVSAGEAPWLQQRESTLGSGAVSGRRLFSPSWSDIDLDFASRMAQGNPGCGERPLRYELSGGVLMRSQMQRVVMPEGIPILGGEVLPDWSSGYHPLEGIPLGSALNNVVPDACAEGVCHGQLLRCPAGAVEAVEVPWIYVELTRPISWSGNMTRQVREIFAVGLAMLPSALDVLAQSTDGDFTDLALDLAGQALASGDRRLSEEIPHEPVVFAIGFASPPPYRVDAGLVRSLIGRGAWRGLVDGREPELGAVEVGSFRLGHPPGRVPAERLPEGAGRGWPAAREAVLLGAILAVAASAAASAVALGVRRRDGYQPVDPKNAPAAP